MEIEELKSLQLGYIIESEDEYRSVINMSCMEETSEYYKSIFGIDIFEEMGKDFAQSFKMAVDIYTYFHEDQLEKDEKTALLGEVLYGEPKKYHGIITEIEGVKNNDNIVDNMVPAPVNMLMQGCERKVTPKLILKIVGSQYFMIDVLCNAIYESKKGLVNNFCRLDIDDHEFQDSFVNYRKSGRKKVEEKELIRTFKDYGHPSPIDAKLRIDEGKQTQIENVVPNIFRLLVSSIEIRKLYGIRGEVHYQFKNVNRLIEESQLEITPLEKWKLEDVVGMNLSAELTNLVIGMTKDITWKDIKKRVIPEIKVLIASITSNDGVFCRGQMVNILEDFVLNKEFEEVSTELAVKRIRYWTEIIMKIKLQLEYEQAFFKNLILCMIYNMMKKGEKLPDKRESDEEKKKVIDYLEHSVLRGIMTDAQFKGHKYPINPQVIQGGKYTGKQADLYSLIQREYMQYQSGKKEV